MDLEQKAVERIKIASNMSLQHFQKPLVVTDDELKKYWSMYCDAWQLFREYMDPDGTDSFYERLTEKVEALNKKHNNSMMKALLLVTLQNIEHRGKIKE